MKHSYGWLAPSGGSLTVAFPERKTTRNPPGICSHLPSYLLPQLASPALRTCPAARWAGGGGGGVVEIRIFSGVVEKESVSKSPWNPGTFTVHVEILASDRPFVPLAVDQHLHPFAVIVLPCRVVLRRECSNPTYFHGPN